MLNKMTKDFLNEMSQDPNYIKRLIQGLKESLLIRSVTDEAFRSQIDATFKGLDDDSFLHFVTATIQLSPESELAQSFIELMTQGKNEGYFAAAAATTPTNSDIPSVNLEHPPTGHGSNDGYVLRNYTGSHYRLFGERYVPEEPAVAPVEEFAPVGLYQPAAGDTPNGFLISEFTGSHFTRNRFPQEDVAAAEDDSINNTL